MKSRKSIELGERFNKRWLGYAAAAGAAGVGLLGSAQLGNADIIYTPANSTVPVNGSLTLNIDGAPALTLTNFALVSTWGPGYWGHFFYGRAGMGAGGPLLAGTSRFAAKLPFGAFIGSYTKGGFGFGQMGSARGLFGSSRVDRTYLPGQGWRTHTWVRRHGFSATQAVGNWLGGGTGYLGFVLPGAYYGWASIDITEISSDYNVRYDEVLTGVAYNTVSGQPILAGQTAATPEPGTLGLLALGSLGLGYWRRKALTSDK